MNTKPRLLTGKENCPELPVGSRVELTQFLVTHLES